MAGSRERLLYERRSDYEYEYEQRRRYETNYTRTETNRYERNRYDRRDRRSEHERPKRKNGYVYEDIYSDFDEAQGRLSLFKPIRPEYLNLPTTYDNKYNSLPRNYYYYDERHSRRYKKDYYDFRIESERRRTRESYDRKQTDVRRNEVTYERRPITNGSRVKLQNTNQSKNVAVCKPLRLPEKNAKYWTTDKPEMSRPKKGEEPKKNVKFSEVSGCNRKMIVNDPVYGRKVVPVRELEVSLDQMIQNGYFEKHNIPTSRAMERASNIAKEETPGVAVPNGKCLSGETGKEKQALRKSRHLPQVSCFIDFVFLRCNFFKDS